MDLDGGLYFSLRVFYFFCLWWCFMSFVEGLMLPETEYVYFWSSVG